jgi:hypothetical protein
MKFQEQKKVNSPGRYAGSINISCVQIVVWSAISLLLLLWKYASLKTNGVTPKKNKVKVNVRSFKRSSENFRCVERQCVFSRSWGKTHQVSAVRGLNSAFRACAVFSQWRVPRHHRPMGTKGPATSRKMCSPEAKQYCNWFLRFDKIHLSGSTACISSLPPPLSHYPLGSDLGDKVQVEFWASPTAGCNTLLIMTLVRSSLLQKGTFFSPLTTPHKTRWFAGVHPPSVHQHSFPGYSTAKQHFCPPLATRISLPLRAAVLDLP